LKFSPFEARSLASLAFLYTTRMLGLFLVLPVLALYAEDYAGSSPLLIGLALGAYGLTQGLLQVPFGFLSDRFGRKPVIIFGMLLFFAGSMLAAVADSIYMIIAGRALQGMGAVASTVMALLSDLTTEQNRTTAMAVVGGSIGVSFAVAMVAGPLLATYWGLSGLFWLTSALALLGIGIMVLLVPTPDASGFSDNLPLPSLFGSILKNSQLLRLNLGIFVLHFVLMASWVSVPVVLEQYLDFSRDRHWWLYLLTMGGGFLAMLPFIWYSESRRKLKLVFVLAIITLAVAEGLLIGAAESLPLLTAGLFIFFMAFNLLEATLPSLISKISPAGAKGTAMGVYSTSQFFGAFCGGAIGGWVVFKFGYFAVFQVSLVAVLVWAIAALTMKPPPYLKSLVIKLEDGEQLNAAQIIGVVPGVEDLVVISEHRVAYVKIDEKTFDADRLQQVIGRPLQ